MKYYQHGGGNKTHEKVEDSDRVDSFEMDHSDGWGTLFCGRHVIDYDLQDDVVYLFLPTPNRPTPELHLTPRGSYKKINLSFTLCGFGGCQVYFICPDCGARCRFLYYRWHDFICRRCARLNYESQQQTVNESHAYKRGIKYARKHLDPFFSPDYMGFPDAVPEKPRGMHWRTFDRHMDKLGEYQRQFERRQLLGAVSLCKKFGINIPEEYWR